MDRTTLDTIHIISYKDHEKLWIWSRPSLTEVRHGVRKEGPVQLASCNTMFFDVWPKASKRLSGAVYLGYFNGCNIGLSAVIIYRTELIRVRRPIKDTYTFGFTRTNSVLTRVQGRPSFRIIMGYDFFHNPIKQNKEDTV
jgi:hypothetical protein